MSALLRVPRLLAMVVWVGGLVFFAFVVAPVAFSVLPSTHEAGMVVGGTLRVLNELGYFCGLVFLLATSLLWLRCEGRGQWRFAAQWLLAALMLAATVYVQAVVIPAMERDRLAAGGAIDAAAPNDPAREDFERLHGISEKVEGSALLLGLGVVVLMGFEDGRTDARPA